jgi:leucyl-tRNA synthetase
MVDFQKIEKKWQKKWEDDGVFKTEVDNRKKYYIAIVYPYMSGLLHLGHLFTYTTSEVLARYKRMNNFNVLVKFGFHCTGTPIVAAAQRVKEKEPTQIATLKKMGIAAKEISKFADPEYWCNYFPKETLKDLKQMGFAIDDRYTFKTTYLDQPYDRFITWQFNKLKEKGYVKKGKHPVIWCPKDNVPVGDHDRSEGEGETPQEFLLFKHKLPDGRYMVSATLRHDTVLGITNLFVHPDLTYVEATIDGEQWIISESAAHRLGGQGFSVSVTGKIKGKSLIGKKTTEFDGSKVLILPATFLDPDVGTGLVHSVPSDSADDLIALRDIQNDEKRMKQFGLDVSEVRSIKPRPVLNTPEYGDVAADAILKKYNVTSQKETEKLKKIKQELYKLSHYTATFNDRYSTVFSKNLVGKKVSEGKDVIKKDLITKGFAVSYYEPTGKVVCRCLTECIINVVSDQWFIEYNNLTWKKKTHDALDSMKIYPEKVRKQFDYVIDWLDHWACTREFGLGTKLPWDDTWVIESLSDSTIQMAYCTIAKYLEHAKDYGFSTEKLNDTFFDYVLLGKGNVTDVVSSTGIPKKMVEIMKRDFNYWYPFDFRNSAKDLLQNHLTFCLFNHVALFPKKQWPQAYVLNGRIMVDNEKMSKSKGNFFTMRELYERHGADIVRLTAANAGEGVEDANYDMTFLETAERKLSEMHDFASAQYSKGRTSMQPIDKWFNAMIDVSVQRATDSIENMLFKSAISTSFMDMHRYLKWYTRRTGGDYNKTIMNKFIETQLKLLAPFVPHFCEEVWHALGKKTYMSNESWPKAKKIEDSVGLGEELIENVLGDVQQVLKLAHISKPTSITLFVADEWKHEALSGIAVQLEKTRDFKVIMQHLLKKKGVKEHAKELSKIIPRHVKLGSVPALMVQKDEHAALTGAQQFLEKEYSCSVRVVYESKSNEQKAKQAMPGKPGVLVE